MYTSSIKKLFNKIIVPVDFSKKSGIAAREAIDVAKQYRCSIHLIHAAALPTISTLSMPGAHIPIPYDATDIKRELTHGLKKLADSISFLAGPDIIIDYSVLYGSWNQVIVDLIRQNKFDLVIIGQEGRPVAKREMTINPNVIASKTNTAVITVPSNRRLTKLRSIVIPVTDFLPVRKLMYGVYMAANFSATIKLLGIENHRTKDELERCLTKSYAFIQNNSEIKAEIERTTGKNIAEAIQQFGLRTSPDLIIVNPETQTNMPGLLSTWLGNILQRFSAPPVLSINPA